MSTFDSQSCLDHIEAATRELAPHELLDSNTSEAARALRRALALLAAYSATARAKWHVEDETE